MAPTTRAANAAIKRLATDPRRSRRSRERGDDDETVLGRVGYWAPDVRFTDMSGLTEPVVARTPGEGGVYGKLNLPYTLSRDPAVVAVNFRFVYSNPARTSTSSAVVTWNGTPGRPSPKFAVAGVALATSRRRCR